MTLPKLFSSLMLFFIIHWSIVFFSSRSLLSCVCDIPVCLPISSKNLELSACFIIWSVSGTHLYSMFASALSSPASNSATWNTLLAPSFRSLNMTTFKFTALRRFFGTLSGGFVSLLIVSVAESACTVAYTLCPVCIASNRTIASSFLLISPSIILSGLILKLFTSRFSMETSPFPSGFGVLVTRGVQYRKSGSISSLVSSTLIILLFGGMKGMHAFKITVFPAAVPPEIKTFISYSIANHKSVAISRLIVLFFIKSTIVYGSLANFLMVIVFPFVLIG